MSDRNDVLQQYVGDINTFAKMRQKRSFRVR